MEAIFSFPGRVEWWRASYFASRGPRYVILSNQNISLAKDQCRKNNYPCPPMLPRTSAYVASWQKELLTFFLSSNWLSRLRRSESSIFNLQMLGVSFQIWAMSEMLDEACDLTWWPMVPAEDNLRCQSKNFYCWCEMGVGESQSRSCGVSLVVPSIQRCKMRPVTIGDAQILSAYRRKMIFQFHGLLELCQRLQHMQPNHDEQTRSKQPLRTLHEPEANGIKCSKKKSAP